MYSPRLSHLLNIVLLEQIPYGVDYKDMPCLWLVPAVRKHAPSITYTS